MFQIDEDMTIHITRGDVVYFSVTASDENGAKYQFKKNDVVRIKVTDKKDCTNVAFQKDFLVEESCMIVYITLTEEETKIGEVISKPVDYWYEIELNPYTVPQTIIGYDEDGAKIFKLYPEGRDIGSPVQKEDIPAVDTELSLTSTRPVENRAVTTAMLELQGRVENSVAEVHKVKEYIETEYTETIKGINESREAEYRTTLTDINATASLKYFDEINDASEQKKTEFTNAIDTVASNTMEAKLDEYTKSILTTNDTKFQEYKGNIEEIFDLKLNRFNQQVDGTVQLAGEEIDKKVEEATNEIDGIYERKLTNDIKGSCITFTSIEGKAKLSGLVHNRFDQDTIYANFKQNDGTFSGASNYIAGNRRYFTEDEIGKTLTFSALLKMSSGMTGAYLRTYVKGTESFSNVVTNINDYELAKVKVTPTSTDDYIDITYQGFSADAGTIYLKNVMLSDIDSPFVPYAGYEVKSVSENIFGGEAFMAAMVNNSSTGYCTVDTNARTITWAQNRAAPPIFSNFKPNTQYTFMVYGHLTNKGSMGYIRSNLSIIYTDGTYTNITIAENTDAWNVIVSNPNKTIDYIKWGFADIDETVAYYDKIGLFEGVLTEEDFKPYVESIVTITNDTELAYIDTYDGLTNIFSDCDVNVKYGASKNGVDMLIQQEEINRIKSLIEQMQTGGRDNTHANRTASIVVRNDNSRTSSTGELEE